MPNSQNSDVLDLTNPNNVLSHSTPDTRTLDENLSAIDDLYSALFHCQDPAELYQKITDTAVSQTVADSAYLGLFDSAVGKLGIRHASGAFNRRLLGTSYEYSEGIIGQVWESGETLFIDDASSSSAIHITDVGTQILASPLIQNDTVVGVLVIVASPDCTEDLSNDSATSLRILNLAAVALSNLTMLATTQTALQHMHAIAGISRELNSANDHDEACLHVCKQLIEGISVCQVGVAIFDVTGHIRKKTLCQSPERASVYNKEFDESVLEQLATQCFGKPGVVIESPDADGSGQYAFAVPLIKEERYIGAVCVVRSPDMPALDSAVLETLKTIALYLGNTLDRLELTHALQHQAFHDQLTRLPNRAQFESELQSTINSGVPGALLFIDLDGFKNVNDTLGHGVGDQLLCHVAKRMSNKLKRNDTLARMGGDEFAVILRDSNDVASATVCANRLLASLSRNFEIQNAQVKVGASIGFSRFPQDGDTVDKLLRNADVAMYEAKNNGKGCVSMFNQGSVDARLELTQVHKDMYLALQENQFELHYQPQVCCSQNEVIGAEALLRWNHPTRGYISPDEFIPLAEQTGLINDIGNWVLDKAVEQIAEWQSSPVLKNIRVGINVAALQLQNDYFVDHVLKSVAKYKFPAHLLELELTESVVMEDISEVANRLKVLQNAGVRIAIDDFGTGYSSLSYLQDLPLDVLKIDRAFVSRLENEDANKSLAHTIALLAVGLGLETIAEGVETLKQRDAITAMGCDLIQGHYYAGAVTPEKLGEYIVSNCTGKCD